MTGIDIHQKVKSGLLKATIATGSGDLVYLLKETKTGGNTPLDPPVVTVEPVLLVDAIFKSINQTLINGDTIRSGDRMLVINGDVLVEQNNVIQQGSSNFKVISVERKEPSGVLLAQFVQLRAQ